MGLRFGGRRRNPFRVASSINRMRSPRVARTQPLAEISERFQRLVAKSSRSSLRLLNVSRYSRHQEYELVIDGPIPIEDLLFEFLVLSPGLSRDERDLELEIVIGQ